ncbi:MAG TPA: hypothetical protein VMV07_22285 [Streptosporangiaceae bacterium]|nr:hypothetical protein [Streptosporangiaceae bacterium]
MPGQLRDRCRALCGAGGFPVGQRHEVAVGCACGAEVVGAFFEFLSEVEHLLFQLVGAGPERFGFVGAPDAAGPEDFFAEYFGQPGGQVGVLPPEPLVLLAEVGQVREQGLLAGGGGCGAVSGGGGMCVDPGAQVVVTVEERPVDALLTELELEFQQFNG